MAGDALTDANLTRLIEFHRSKNALATIGLKEVEDVSGFGIAVLDGHGRIIEFQEKPSPERAKSNLANTMIYVFEPEIFNYIPTYGKPDFAQDIFPLLIRESLPFYGLALDGYWCDIGTLKKYHTSHKDILLGKVDIKLSGVETKQGIFICEGAKIHRTCKLCPPVYIGEHVEIRKNATIGPYSVIGTRCEIREDATVQGSVVWNNTKIGKKVNVIDCVVGSDCYLESGASLGKGVVLSDQCFVEEDSIIKKNVRIDPGRIVKRKVDVW